MKLAHARPWTCDGTLRHTLRTVLWSYDSPARGGLQYPPSPGMRGKFGESVSKRNEFSRAGIPPLYVVRHQHFPARLHFIIRTICILQFAIGETNMAEKKPTTSYKEVKIGNTLYRVTSVFTGEKDLGKTLEQLAVRRAMAELTSCPAQT